MTSTNLYLLLVNGGGFWLSRSANVVVEAYSFRNHSETFYRLSNAGMLRSRDQRDLETTFLVSISVSQ